MTYDSYGPVYNRFHRGEWIMWASGGGGEGGEGALDIPGPLNGNERSIPIQKMRVCGYETLRYVHYFSYLKVHTHLSCLGEGVGPHESARDFVQPDGA